MSFFLNISSSKVLKSLINGNITRNRDLDSSCCLQKVYFFCKSQCVHLGSLVWTFINQATGMCIKEINTIYFDSNSQFSFLALFLSRRPDWDIQEFSFVTFPFLWLVVFLIVYQAFPGLPGFLAQSSCESTCSAWRFSSLSNDCWSQLTAQKNHRTEVNLDATVCRVKEKSPALQWQVHMNAARIQQSHIHVLVDSSQAEAELS